MTAFAELGLSEAALAAVERMGYDSPTPVQEQSIPYILEGRDVIAAASTGTGKTAAFLLPTLSTLERMKGRGRAPRVCVVSPTRELAQQISRTCMQISRKTGHFVTTVYGGTPYGPQIRELRGGTDVLIATPGRLNDLMDRGVVDLSETKVLVLDEASAMLDPRGRAGLMRVCHELHERGMTIVMITHYMEEAAQADRVVVMERGHVALEGTPDEVLVQARALAHLNLDVPFAARLSLDLRDAGMAVQPTVDAGKLAREVLALGKAAGICTTADANAAAPDAADADVDFPTCEGDADAPALIELQDVSFTYDAAEAKRQRKRKQAPAARQAKWGNSPDSLWAVRDVSLQVHRGEFLGVAGHTGSGKSTLIQHMNGILKPTSGRVLVDGTDIASKGAESKVRGSIGVVFQYPEHQLFAETVYKDVAFGPRNLGLSGEEVDALVRSSLDRVGLSFDELAEKSPFELSGGQQRRVAFAGVLAMDPQVLVLDEPAAGLDPASKRSFLEMISRLHDQGLTVVMVSHCMDDLAAMCDRVAVMNEGRLLGVGAPERLFLHARKLKEVGLGTTEPQAFAEALRAGGWTLEQGKLYTEKELAGMIAAACGAGSSGNDAAWPSPAGSEGQVTE